MDGVDRNPDRRRSDNPYIYEEAPNGDVTVAWRLLEGSVLVLKGRGSDDLSAALFTKDEVLFDPR